MESAIPEHLKTHRTVPARIAQDFVTPYPAWTARPKPEVVQMVMAYFGVQYDEKTNKALQPKALAAMNTIVAHLNDKTVKDPSSLARHHDLTHYVDEAGYHTYMVIAYWDSTEAYEHWSSDPGIQKWWESLEALKDGLGYFREVFLPRSTHFETIFSTKDKLEGMVVVPGADYSKEDIVEHGYWGSMRDRMPASQTDTLAAADHAAPAILKSTGPRVWIRGHDNVALIRSGQDWSQITGPELKLYNEKIAPVLKKGMDFLCTPEGHKQGCYYNRFVRLINEKGVEDSRTFGVSVWKSMAQLEGWSAHHPTHVAIFGTFMEVVEELKGQLKLRLYHEVIVAQSSEQRYEYIHCHAGTGMLRTVPAGAKL